METMWLKEALFSGMTSNAFKLGTVLTLGWFWPRVSGCSVLYRGSSMETIDFSDILAVTGVNDYSIGPSSYVQHNSSTTYFYVVRRANNYGEQEQTLAAAARVSIDINGDLAPPQPNDVFGIKAEQAASSKVQLVWYYCPVEQKSKPVFFKIYYDNGTGQIDYENPVAVIQYAGRRFYSYQSDALQAERNLFAIRTEDAIGTQNRSLARVEIQFDSMTPDSINILSTETS